MTSLLTDLERLKRSVSPHCTFKNVQMLQTNWLQFHHLLSSLPEPLRGQRAVLEELSIKIDSICNDIGSRRRTRLAFKEAVARLQMEIDQAIQQLEPCCSS